tara:strand:+ start:1275 stop:5099 length:3825 start_codon:yes stop_codon:yes gene_type:complete
MAYRNFPSLTAGTTSHIEVFPSITMFDASTFYNWEQDNIPIQQLKDRTDTLLRHAGYNEASRPAGTVTYTLSSAENVDYGIYSNMGKILDLIPKRLTYPILVEVCDYGALGTMELADVVTEGAGQLEIRNRLFAKDPSSVVIAVSSTHIGAEGSVNTLCQVGNAGDAELWTALKGVQSTRFSHNLYDAASWQSSGTAGFFQRGPDLVDETVNLSVWTEGVSAHAVAAGVSGFPYSAFNDLSIATLDPSPSSMSNRRTYLGTSRGADTTSHTAAGSVYGNVFNGISIRGCRGDIKLTGLCVDGSNLAVGVTLKHVRTNGIEVVDSEIVLEDCASMRCSKTGVYAKNSSISIASGLICYRNYENDGGIVARTSNLDNYGVGLHAVNSEIFFATVDESTDALTVAAQPNERRNLYNFTKNEIGILLESSKLHGGTLWTETNNLLPRTRGAGNDKVTSFLQTYGNKTGLKLENSQITWLGIFDSFLNHNHGVESNNSTLNLTQFTIEDNGLTGFNLDNSRLIYGYLGDKLGGDANGHNGDSSVSYKRSYTCSRNGQNLIIDNGSQVTPYECDEVRKNLGCWGGAGESIAGGNKSMLYDYMFAVGASKTITNAADTCDIPSIVVKNGSRAEFIGLACAARTRYSRIKGACVSVTDNSKVTFRGTSKSRTALTIEPSNAMALAELSHSWQTAGVYAGRNSVVEFTGPTKLSRFGVPVLAEDGSTMMFGPPTIDGSESKVDIDRFSCSSIQTDSTNDAEQTSVEIHSTRAGLVVNKNSNIRIFHIGGWASDANYLSNYSTDSLMNNNHPSEMDRQLSACTSAGYFRFFPNGFTSGMAGLESVKLAATPARHKREVSLSQGISNPERRLVMSVGGMCVRAIGNSTVDVNGVNFKFEGDASSCSGVFYDYKGAHRLANNPDPYIVNNRNWWSRTAPTTLASHEPGGYMMDSSAFNVSGITKVRFNNGNAATLYNTSSFMPNLNSEQNGVGNAKDAIVYPAYASNLMMWNIADTSRIHVANCKINKLDPSSWCDANSAHGPRGKWANGVALDYYGAGGLATTYNPKLRVADLDRGFENYGIFRLLLGHRGQLKSLVEVSAGQYGDNAVSPGFQFGGAIDQINGAGYQTWTSHAMSLSAADLMLLSTGLEGASALHGIGGLSGTEEVFGQGWAASAVDHPAGIQGVLSQYVDAAGNTRINVPGMPIPPLHMDWQGYMRNFLDESGANLFTNAKHASSKKVNAVSIYHSTTNAFGIGGEGRDADTTDATYGVGCRSLNLFDLDRLL